MAITRYLSDLAEATGDLLLELTGAPATEVTGVASDARRVAAGDLFVCVVGTVTDGHLYAAEAVAAGAVAIVCERPTGAGVPEMVVADSRRAMGMIASEFYGHPSDDMLMLGVTGTNGKTTTAYLLESILSAEGRSTGLIGTIETRVAGSSRPGVRTTPDVIELQALLAEMRDAGVDAVAMEVTSHGLVLHRVEGIRFAAVGFTNLSQDHLDFHRTMEDYFEAKRSLFVPERAERGAVNIDDPYGRRLFESAPIPCWSFGLTDEADVWAEDVRFGPSSTAFRIRTPKGDVEVESPLVGTFNVSNCLAAAAVALLAGVGPNAIEEGLRRVRSVPGRFEVVDRGQPFTVAVDYAHTPDSLDNVLRAARAIADRQEGRVICVFGCGGDRDRGKRPLMGAIAAKLADVAIVTSDNPRSEDPQSILDQIIEGVLAERAGGPDHATVDRAAAIRHALGLATTGDVVVIAGKGHETGQEFADRTIPFDDRIVASDALAELGYVEAAR
jgi:UDP-N-acetylmuramoyl-L-alanyl-D-glutamate--2,6-diaminopimelate ligase